MFCFLKVTGGSKAYLTELENTSDEINEEESVDDSDLTTSMLDSPGIADVSESTEIPPTKSLETDVPVQSTPTGSDRYSDLPTVEQVLSNSTQSVIILPSFPDNCDIMRTPPAYSSLPHPKLIRTGTIVAVLKHNPGNRRLLGKIAFFPYERKRISRTTEPLKNGSSMEGAICMFIPYSPRHELVKLDPLTIPRGQFYYSYLLIGILIWI